MANVKLTFDFTGPDQGRGQGANRGQYAEFIELVPQDTITIYPPSGYQIIAAKLYTGQETARNSNYPNEGGTFRIVNDQKNADMRALRGSAPDWTIFNGNPGFSNQTISIDIDQGTNGSFATITDCLTDDTVKVYEYLIHIRSYGNTPVLDDFLDPGIRNR